MTARDQDKMELIYTPHLSEIVARLWAQARSLRPVMLVIYVPVMLVFGVLVAVRLSTGIAIAEFTRAPLAFTGIPVYTGVLSHIGVIVWSATAAICLFGYSINRWQSDSGSACKFLLAGGLITFLFLLDDFFMLHELVFPESFGIPQRIVYGAYVLILLWYLVWFRTTILHTDFLLLALPFVGFGVSAAVDITASINPYPGLYVFEDSGKLFGIVSWAAYFVLVSARSVAPYARRHELESEHDTPGATAPGMFP